MFNFKYHSRFFGAAKKGKFPSNILLKLALCLFVSQSHHAFCQAGDIRIKLNHIKTDKGGNLVICVFRGENGFPEDGSKALRILKTSLRNEVIITEIPKGEYAVSLLHDIDGNGKMTYSFLGIPKDGFSSSPEGGPSLKKPDYKSARFFHDGKGSMLEMKVHYLP
jgi:uncharacterized protein (DUF2141 family)